MLAFGARDIAEQLVLMVLAFVALYAAARLVDVWGLGRRKSSRWRFLGPDTVPRRRGRRPGHAAADEDPFHVLEIAPTEDLRAISAAYIRLARLTHPDLHPHDSQAKAKFQRVQRAFSRIGDQQALQMYLMDHPLDAPWDDFSPEPDVTPVDLDLFRQDLVAYRALWRLKQAAAERDRKYLQGGHAAGGLPMIRRLRKWLNSHFGRQPRKRLVVQRVCFLPDEYHPGSQVAYLQVFDKLLCVGTQDQLHEVITFLLNYNGVHFVDLFHTGDRVSFHDIGREPGRNAALSPSGSYADFVTNLAKLGLYEGPDVQQDR